MTSKWPPWLARDCLMGRRKRGGVLESFLLSPSTQMVHILPFVWDLSFFFHVLLCFVPHRPTQGRALPHCPLK